ncbi:molybdopterin-guanine dinucleotide biosynthesis protein B [Sedimenticola thiotaurini]|uniref:Molybdopterin-guanine dinucleotide biosynthesis protein B n=1 Tax=Sedimenticola thiotaurini TaxID=1543721 RepID=A0A0F7JYU9_9GAMM|nr:molybdopterin-guanine dinucleotide biosynthesis protein B [Sedimenticola thiotaurini]AKH20494.1 molybdopterin-guanine dinucleotide biosynthesis protein B [Sedimenticola thiotaurini]
MIEFPLPIFGFSAFSGTGKTRLLTQVLQILGRQGLRIGAVKHAHHRFEVDHPQSDSYQLRMAGADQMLVASPNRMALVTELDEAEPEPRLAELLRVLDPSSLDLVLVEGFKRERFPKIELHRPSLGKRLLYPDDPDIIAIATDGPLTTQPCHIPLLNLNQPDSISDFLLARCFGRPGKPAPVVPEFGQG